MNIEIGGLIYEITNADDEWVHGEGSTLQSGTDVILPISTEIIGNAKIDFKGGKPRVWVEGQQQQQQLRKILITGSSGYVGQHLLASLALHGIGSTADSSEGATYEIFLAYNSLPTFEEDLKLLLEHNNKLHKSVVLIKTIPNVDFSNSNYILKLHDAGATTLDVIIHLAALSSPGFCENNASDAWKVNCPVELLTFKAPIIYLSTDQVYEGTKSYYHEDTDETLPVNVYGRTKLAFERVLLGSQSLLSAKELGGESGQYMPNTMSIPPPHPKSTILRSSLILGGPTPLKNGCRKGSFPSFLQFIESRLQSSTPTDYFINEFRSVVHVEDVLRAIRHFLNKALDSEGVSQRKAGVYNLGGRTRVSRYDIALKLANHLKLDHSTAKGVDRPASGGGVPSPPDISMNVDKVASEIGVAKMDGLSEIIEQTFSVGE